MIEILSTRSLGPTSAMDLTNWVTANELRITTVRDAPGMTPTSLSAYGVRESAFLVDLSSMRIVRKINGSVAGVGPSAIEQIIPEMLRLLGASP